MTYVAVRVSGKPADAEHHYGHGKVESISALAETALLFLLSGVVAWEAGKRLLARGHAVDARSGLRRHCRLDRGRLLPRPRAVAHREGDIEPGAGSRCAAFLFRPVGLFRGADRPCRRAFRPAWADTAAALAVAVLVCIAGWRLGRRTIDTLTDTAPQGAAEDHRDRRRCPRRGQRRPVRARTSATRHSSISRPQSAARCRSIR